MCARKIWQKNYIQKIVIAIVLLLLMSLPLTLRAADLPLSNAPVLDSAAEPPNIILFIDSSGSMFDNDVPDTGGKSRMQVARESAIGLVNALSNVRLGLAIFDDDEGARILVGVNDIATNRNTVISQINNIPNTGWTPLAEAMHELGRYFVQGKNNSLTMHPGQINQVKRQAYTIFDAQPRYSSGVLQTSPIQNYCQKNFIILITDGEPTQDRDINATTGLQDYDSDCVNRVPACLTFDRKPAGSGYTYSTNGSDYVDDVVTAMNDMDLRPDLKAPAGVIKKSNVITYPVGFADPSIQNNPLMTDIATGGGGQYIFASGAASLVTALNEVAGSILTQVTTAAAVAFSTVSLTTDSAVYVSQYNTANWTGNLLKLTLNTIGELTGTAWNAATKLDATNPSNRTIITYNRDNLTGMPFRTYSLLSTALQNDLKFGGDATLGQRRLDYLRGVRTYEGSLFRMRVSVLGDIVNSAPVFVGAPSSGWPDTAPFPTGSDKYSSFKSTNKNRTSAVYVGANDGMLHGFNGDNGNEIIAYVPTSVVSSDSNAGLHYLTNPAYQHLFYVDLTPVVEDAYVKVTPTGTASWHTILIGGDKNGGNGYFALDVTNPNNFSESNADALLLWEFSSLDDSRLGKTYSEPVIGLMNNGRWAAIFGNGYNATGTNKATLFIAFLDGGLDGVWTEGTDYFVIATDDGTLPHPNGLTSPAAVDLDGNGTIDRVYAGDYAGSMWAFNVTSSTASNWAIAYGTTNNPVPLFKAPSGQKITTKPTVVKNTAVVDTTTNVPNTLVLFGTGSLLNAADKTVTDTQTFYGIWDHGNGNIQQNALVEQTFTTTGNKRVLTDDSVPYVASSTGQQKEGWKINFTNGERVITTPAVRTGVVFFNTVIPNTSGACAFGGTGWLMTADVLNGGEPDEVIFDVNNDDQLTDVDKLNNHVVSGIQYDSGVPAESSFLSDLMFTATSSGEVERRKVIDVSVKRGRISWREIELD